MADYTDREKLLAKIDEAFFETDPDGKEQIGVLKCRAIIREIPAADVAPVVHGRWECVYDDSTGETDITCSHCKNTRTVNGCFVSADKKSCYFEDDYCPNCGARMNGDAE